MSIIDIIIGFFTFGALGRGYQTGFSYELERLVKVGLSFFGSLGLFRYTREFLQNLLGLDSGLAGFAGFVGSFALIYWGVRFLRQKLRHVLVLKFGKKMKPAGAVLGAVHAAAASLALLSGLVLVDWSLTNKFILKNSRVAEVAAHLVGKRVHGESANEAVSDKLDHFRNSIKDRGTAIGIDE